MSALNTPMKKLAAMAALTVGSVFSASAHVPPEHEALLKKHEDFIMNMKRPDGFGGTCCNRSDVYINPPQRRLPDGTVIVTLDKDNQGNPITPVEITIPPEKVLSGRFAAEVCKEMTAAGSTTCTPPAPSIIWANPLSPYVYCYWPGQRMSLR
jgi:hypothetical protein